MLPRENRSPRKPGKIDEWPERAMARVFLPRATLAHQRRPFFPEMRSTPHASLGWECDRPPAVSCGLPILSLSATDLFYPRLPNLYLRDPREVACSVCIDHSGQASTAKAAQAVHCPTANWPHAFATTGMAKAMSKFSSFLWPLLPASRAAGAPSRPLTSLRISTPDSSGDCSPRLCSEIWRGAHTEWRSLCPDENQVSP